jgi:hypothetical protein
MSTARGKLWYPYSPTKLTYSTGYRNARTSQHRKLKKLVIQTNPHLDISARSVNL